MGRGGRSLHGIARCDDGNVRVVPGVIAGDADEHSDSYQQDDYGPTCPLRAVVASREPPLAEGSGLHDAGEVVDSADGKPNRMPIEAFQAKCSPHPNHSPCVRNQAMESKSPASIVTSVLVQVAPGLKMWPSPKRRDMPMVAAIGPMASIRRAIGVAAKCDFFGERGDREGDKVEKEQTEGARL